MKNNFVCQSTIKRLSSFLDINSGWMHKHVMNCPACQNRLQGYSKVELALTTIKSQNHKLDLLARANEQTLAHLKHNLRKSEKAVSLKNATPEPTAIQIIKAHSQSVISAAACLMILCLMRVGVFSTMQKAQDKGDNIVSNIYFDHLDDDTNDIA